MNKVQKIVTKTNEEVDAIIRAMPEYLPLRKCPMCREESQVVLDDDGEVIDEVHRCKYNIPYVCNGKHVKIVDRLNPCIACDHKCDHAIPDTYNDRRQA